MRRFCLACLALFAVFHTETAAAGRAKTFFGEGLAVNIKLERITKDEIRKLAGLGFRNVRIGINWPEVERQRGRHAWNHRLYREKQGDDIDETPAFSYDDMIAFLRAHDVHMATTLFYGNTLYTGDPVTLSYGDYSYTIPAAPRTSDGISGFAAFATATAKHYSDLYGAEAFTWLIWNEPETDGGFPPKTDGAIVGHFITTVCESIKKAVPQARIMAPAVSVKDGGAFRYDFMRSLFEKTNPLTCLDAFTVHPYRPSPPETVAKDYAELRSFLKPWQPDHPVPVAVDEWGYPVPALSPTQRLAWRDYSLEEHAAIQLRLYLVNLAEGIPFTAIYEWRDSGPDPRNDEHVYGMNTFDGREKPAIAMWRHIMPNLKGRKLAAATRARLCGGNAHMMRFEPRYKKEQALTLAWTESSRSNIRLAAPGGDVTDIFGRKKNQETGMRLGGIPLLIETADEEFPRLACDHKGASSND